MKNRYLISKGWEGFCDRLQCLSHCVTWSLRYNRILYVDWRDRIWTHDKSDFYRYFSLVDLPYITSAESISANLDIFPSFWKGGAGLIADEWVYRLKDQLTFDPQEGRHFEPIWVHAGIGFRAYDFTILPRHLRFSDEVRSALKPLINQDDSSLPIVHLRGTDREVDESRWEALRHDAPVARVISDDAMLAQRWMAESPDSILLSNTLVGGKVAGHKLPARELKTKGWDKHAMNIRLLADFVLLAEADEAFALNDKSVFFTMARLFGKCGGVDALFLDSSSPVVGDGYLLRQSPE